MQVSDQQQVVDMLQADWGLQLPGFVSEETILEQLEKRIMAMADKDPEAFFQLMYRLDVSEQKVKSVLFEQDAGMQIAKLVYKRQLQKIEARNMFRSAASDVDEDLKW
jgi:hypothetical protein